MKRILTCTQKFSEWSENHALRCVLREAHLQEMANFNFNDGKKRMNDILYAYNQKNKDITKMKFGTMLVQAAAGNTQGVVFKDNQAKPTTVRPWLQEIFNALRNQYNKPPVDSTGLQRLSEIPQVCEAVIQNLEKNGWKKNSPISVEL
jgi:uncharacterized alpha/beta hydrolase family protein